MSLREHIAAAMAEHTPKEEAPPPENQEAAETTEPDLPAHWADEEKQKWSAVPPEHKQLLMDARKSLEQGYDGKFKALEEKRRNWKELKSIFEPFKPYMGGGTKLQAIRQWASAQAALMQKPEDALPWLAKSYAGQMPAEQRKTLLNRLANELGVAQAAPSASGTDDYLDPVAGRKISSVESELAQLKGVLNSTLASQQQAALQHSQKVLESFKKEAPYFDEVQGEVMDLLRKGIITATTPEARLKEAYDKAIRLNDAVWTKLQQEKEAARAKEAAEKRRAETAKAKDASRNVRGEGGRAEAKGSGNMRSILEEEFAKRGLTAR